MLFKPLPVTLVTGDFIPSRVEGDNTFLLVKMADSEVFTGPLVHVTDYFAEKMTETANSTSPEAVQDLGFLRDCIQEYSLFFGESRIFFSVRTGDQMPEISLYGVSVIKEKEPELLLKSLFDQISSKTDDLTVIPYSADLGEDVLPLYQIFDKTTGMTISVALFGTGPVFLLFSSGTEGLRDMIKAAADPSGKLEIQQKLTEMNSIYLSMDTSMFKELLESEGMNIFSEKPVILEVSFQKDNEGWTIRSHSNAADIFMSEEQRKSCRPIRDIPEFPGGGQVIGFIHGRTSSLDRSRIENMLNDPRASEARLGLEYFQKLYGITLEDIVDLFGGSFSLVIGGKSFSPLGEIPGCYVMFQPEKEGITEKFMSIVPLLNLPFPLKQIEIPEWERVYGIDSVMGLTIACRNKQFLAGVIDPQQLLVSLEIPENMSRFMRGESYGIFALSVRRIEEELMEISKKMRPIIQDGRMDNGIRKFRETLGNVDSFIARGESLYDSFLKILINQESE